MIRGKKAFRILGEAKNPNFNSVKVLLEKKSSKYYPTKYVK